MVGTELDQLKLEIAHYLGLPYWKNVIKDGKVVKEGILGGKGSSKEIALKTIEIANTEGIDILKLNNRQFHNFQKKHHIGIDCSGLAYNLLDFYYQLLHQDSVFECLMGVKDANGNHQKGVRKVNADMLTSSINAFKIDNYDDIKTADLIRMDNGTHVIFIIEKIGNIIHYVHSSHRTQNSGVHLGSITITDPAKSLEFQQWTDLTTDGKPYNEFFNPKNGDGIFRLNCLK